MNSASRSWWCSALVTAIFNRCKLRFSLLTFVVFIPVIASVLIAWSPLRRAIEIDRLNRVTANSIAGIENAGGAVETDTQNVILGWGWHTSFLAVRRVHFQQARAASGMHTAFPRSPALYQALRNLPASFELDVTGTDFNNDDLGELQSSQLAALYANESGLTDQLLSGECSERLIAVYVKNTIVGDSFVKWISSRKLLVFADLSGTQITDAAVPALDMNARLTTVDVRNTELSDEGVRSLRNSRSVRHVTAD